MYIHICRLYIIVHKDLLLTLEDHAFHHVLDPPKAKKIIIFKIIMYNTVYFNIYNLKIVIVNLLQGQVGQEFLQHLANQRIPQINK